MRTNQFISAEDMESEISGSGSPDDDDCGYDSDNDSSTEISGGGMVTKTGA